jgi:hypothetical protein
MSPLAYMAHCSSCGYKQGALTILIPAGRCPSCGGLMLQNEQRGRQVAEALDVALRDAPEAKANVEDAVIVFNLLRQWYGAEARDVLRAALELAEVQS